MPEAPNPKLRDVPPPQWPAGNSPYAYAELDVKTNFSFLRGASHPDELVYRAAELGYRAIGVTDFNSLAGVVRAHQAAKEVNLPLLIGSRLTFTDAPDLLVWAPDRPAYARLCRLLTLGKRRAEKGECVLSLNDFLAESEGMIAAVVEDSTEIRIPNDEFRMTKGEPRISTNLHESQRINSTETQDRRVRLGGRVSSDVSTSDASVKADPTNACDSFVKIHADSCKFMASPLRISTDPLSILKDTLRDRLSLTVSCAYGPDDATRLARAAELSRHFGIPLLATNDVYYHDPARRSLQDVLTCVRHGCTIREAGFKLFPNGERYLKSPEQMHRLFANHPQAIHRGLEIATQCAFKLDELRYEYPDELTPSGKTGIEYLSDLAWSGARSRYPAGIPEKIARLLKHELALIEQLRFEHYFLTVYDLVTFARSRGILCQGRGSAANSAVCYCIGVTSVDPTQIDLLFERFISAARGEPPDIDVDFEHERREEVLQYLYDKYGRDRAAMTAEVITYRGRSAVRDVGKAMGLNLDMVDSLAGKLDWWHKGVVSDEQIRETGLDPADRTIRQVMSLATEVLGFPRHLSQHVGGMVMTRGPLCEMVPIENATMNDRTMIEWDKDDIDAVGILKVDVLALGMLTCISKAFRLVEQYGKSEFRIPNSESNPNDQSPIPNAGEPRISTNLHESSRMDCADRRVRLGGRVSGDEHTEDASAKADPTNLPKQFLSNPDERLAAKAPRDEEVLEIQESLRTFAPSRQNLQPFVKIHEDSCGLVAPPHSECAPPDASPLTPALSPEYGGEGARQCLELHTIPPEDPLVYDMICNADTIGVFQVESRAQMSMLPRLRPRSFYDLVIEVAIVRPGPIQGDMVHPYLRRRAGLEPVTFPSKDLYNVLEKTLGVPLFQEQAMRVAMVGAGFTAEEADKLRRVMASWRRTGAIETFHQKIVDGMLRNGYTQEFAEQCFNQIKGFGEYGFPESHAASFALLVYVSAWLKCHHPAAFAAALLNSQPMGFYMPAQIVRDAKDHGVEVRAVDVNASKWDCTLESGSLSPVLGGEDWGEGPGVENSKSEEGEPRIGTNLHESSRINCVENADRRVRIADRESSLSDGRGGYAHPVRSADPTNKLGPSRVRLGGRVASDENTLDTSAKADPTNLPNANLSSPDERLAAKARRDEEVLEVQESLRAFAPSRQNLRPFVQIREDSCRFVAPPLRNSDFRFQISPGPALRLGLRQLKGFRQEHATRIVTARNKISRFTSIPQFHRLTGLPVSSVRILAEADAFGSLGLSRREASWQVMKLNDEHYPLFDDVEADEPKVELPKMHAGQEVMTDYKTAGLSLKQHPVSLLREELSKRKILSAADLMKVEHNRWVKVAGLVLIRQRPGTASGVVFETLEDETGIINLIVHPAIYDKYRPAARHARLLQADGYVQRQGQVLHVLPKRLFDLSDLLEGYQMRSRDFH